MYVGWNEPQRFCSWPASQSPRLWISNTYFVYASKVHQIVERRHDSALRSFPLTSAALPLRKITVKAGYYREKRLRTPKTYGPCEHLSSIALARVLSQTCNNQSSNRGKTVMVWSSLRDVTSNLNGIVLSSVVGGFFNTNLLVSKISVFCISICNFFPLSSHLHGLVEICSWKFQFKKMACKP